MKVTGSSIQQLEKDKPRSRCRKWRLWASTSEGRKSRRFTGTWTQAQDALQAFVDELCDKVPNADTFGAYAASWRLWRAKSGDYSPNTVYSDETCVNALSRTPLADMRMDEVTPQDCRDAMMWLMENPRKVDSYGAATLAQFHGTMKAVFQQAVDDGALAGNPMSSVQRPKVAKPERTALTPDELALFLNRVDELPMSGDVMALYLMACLGLRCGEACALRDDEVRGGFAHVNSTVRGADGSVGRTKSEAGRRVLPVPPRLQAKVDDWRAMRRAMGWQDAPTLACNANGGLLTTKAMRAWWRKRRAAMGCEGMVLHELRHSNLSMMARHMSPFDLQRYAGWSTIAPARIYVHDDLDAVSRAVQEAWA